MEPSFENLFYRCIHETATQAEREELLNLLPEHKDKFRQLVAEVFYKLNPEEDLSKETANALLQTIFSAGADKTDKRAAAPIARMHFLKGVWWRYAAAVLLLLGAGVYVFYNTSFNKRPAEASRSMPKVVPTPLIHDVIPGGNKASLTLADGSVISIDSVPNGKIALQGGAVIMKSDDAIVYTIDKANNNNAPIFNTMTTPRGGQYRLALPDGSMVWLDAASSITFPAVFTEKEREVSITGEVYFEVAKDKERPFLVNISHQLQVQVLGTHFNINAYNDEASVSATLIEGSIIIKNDKTVKALNPGQKAQVGADGSITLKKDVDVQDEIAWKDGEFHFGEKADFGSIMRQIARWYDIEVEYRGVVDAHIGGSISRNVNISLVLQMLEKAGGVKFDMEGRKVIVTP